MKITFLGTGTSMGVPIAGGFGKDKLSGDPRNIRWRCSAWIRTPDASIIIDTGPEFRLQTLRSGITNIDLVLITHEHMDHIAGLDDLRPFCLKKNKTLPLYTTKEAGEAIKRRFEYMFGPNRYPGATSLDIQVLRKPVTFRDVTITPLPVKHGCVNVMGFRMNDISYLTDVKDIPEPTRKLIRGSRLMVLSGLRWEPEHPTHLTIPEARKLADEMNIPQTYLIHMNSYVNHEKSNRKLPEHVQLAYDQLTLEI